MEYYLKKGESEAMSIKQIENDEMENETETYLKKGRQR